MTFWTDYYEGVAARGPRLDFSTFRQQHETWLTVLRLAGEVSGASVLDAGCGWGQLLDLCDVLGAASTTGFDLATTVQASGRPGLVAADLADPATWPAGRFDLVVTTEALHVLDDPAGALAALWARTRPGGRLVATMMNLDHPLQYPGRHEVPFYGGFGEAGLNPLLRSLADVATWRVEGLHLADDQRVEVFDSRRRFEPEPFGWALCAVRSAT